ncbi:hypothetical protein HMPREF0673_02452 [Leyella stercorea DSM 18206]|uniref:Uncharacterized protein n=1 Tax=Leyella stercorea DSM 18206 TaxID=1002367 RepID=G6B0N3_9BACT|nr:hypothetical protein HMPREF0673_02452 [Leyella stercorea DSM 18206]
MCRFSSYYFDLFRNNNLVLRSFWVAKLRIIIRILLVACVKFAINIKMQSGGAVVSTAPVCFVGAFCFVGAVETTAPPNCTP